MSAERDDLGAVLVLDPLEHHARVEAARVEQQHAPDLAGAGLVGAELGRVVLIAHRSGNLAAAELRGPVAPAAVARRVTARRRSARRRRRSGIGHGQRRQQPDRVGAGGVDDQALLEQQAAGEAGRVVAVEADHQAATANVEAERGQPGEQPLALARDRRRGRPGRRRRRERRSRLRRPPGRRRRSSRGRRG